MKKITISQLVEFVRGIWEKGYGCPLSTNAIVTKFEKLFQIDQKYRKGEGRGVQQAIWSQEKRLTNHLLNHQEEVLGCRVKAMKISPPKSLLPQPSWILKAKINNNLMKL